MLEHQTSNYAWSRFKARCAEVIKENSFSAVADLGGGRNPLFTWDEVAALSVNYTVIDISSNELNRCDRHFTKICTDICDLRMHNAFDFVFSLMFCEHIRDPRRMHLTVLNALRPGGEVFHFFPARYCLPFVINRILPDSVTRPILLKIRPDRDDSGMQPKFKAYYRRCTGPTVSAQHWFTKLGYEVIEHTGFYGHSYFRNIPIVSSLSSMIDEVGAKTNNPYLCSYSFLRLRKPASLSGSALARAS